MLLIYDVEPQFKNPKAIIFNIASIKKMHVKNLSTTTKAIKNPDLGSIRGLSAAI
jgi:hypothetical protein